MIPSLHSYANVNIKPLVILPNVEFGILHKRLRSTKVNYLSTSSHTSNRTQFVVTTLSILLNSNVTKVVSKQDTKRISYTSTSTGKLNYFAPHLKDLDVHVMTS